MLRTSLLAELSTLSVSPTCPFVNGKGGRSSCAKSVSSGRMVSPHTRHLGRSLVASFVYTRNSSGEMTHRGLTTVSTWNHSL